MEDLELPASFVFWKVFEGTEAKKEGGSMGWGSRQRCSNFRCAAIRASKIPAFTALSFASWAFAFLRI